MTIYYRSVFLLNPDFRLLNSPESCIFESQLNFVCLIPMKKTRFTLILLLLLLFPGTGTFAQDLLKVDSLSALLLEAVGEDRLPLLLELSMEIIMIDEDQGYEYADEAIELARQFGTTEQIYEAIDHKGGLYYNMARDKDALEIFQQSLAFSEEENYMKGKANSLYRIGRSYTYLRDYVQSDDYLNQALALAREIKDKKIEGQVFYAQGANLRIKAKFDEALDKFAEAIVIATEENDLATMNSCNSEIGAIYFGQGDYEEAIVYYQEAKNTGFN